MLRGGSYAFALVLENQPNLFSVHSKAAFAGAGASRSLHGNLSGNRSRWNLCRSFCAARVDRKRRRLDTTERHLGRPDEACSGDRHCRADRTAGRRQAADHGRNRERLVTVQGAPGSGHSHKATGTVGRNHGSHVSVADHGEARASAAKSYGSGPSETGAEDFHGLPCRAGSRHERSELCQGIVVAVDNTPSCGGSGSDPVDKPVRVLHGGRIGGLALRAIEVVEDGIGSALADPEQHSIPRTVRACCRRAIEISVGCCHQAGKQIESIS